MAYRKPVDLEKRVFNPETQELRWVGDTLQTIQKPVKIQAPDPVQALKEVEKLQAIKAEVQDSLPSGVSGFLSNMFQPFIPDTIVGAKEMEPIVDKLRGIETPENWAEAIAKGAYGWYKGTDAALADTAAFLLRTAVSGGHHTAKMYHEIQEGMLKTAVKAIKHEPTRTQWGQPIAPAEESIEKLELRLAAEERLASFQAGREHFEKLSEEGMDTVHDIAGIPSEAKTTVGRAIEHFLGEELIPMAPQLAAAFAVGVPAGVGKVVYQGGSKVVHPLIARIVAGSAESVAAFSEFRGMQEFTKDPQNVEKIIQAISEPVDHTMSFFSKVATASYHKADPPKDPKDLVEFGDINLDEWLTFGFNMLGGVGGVFKYRKDKILEHGFLETYKGLSKVTSDLFVKNNSVTKIAILQSRLREEVAKGAGTELHAQARIALQNLRASIREAGITLPKKVIRDITPASAPTAEAQKIEDIINLNLKRNNTQKLLQWMGLERAAKKLRPELYGGTARPAPTVPTGQPLVRVEGGKFKAQDIVTQAKRRKAAGARKSQWRADVGLPAKPVAKPVEVTTLGPVPKDIKVRKPTKPSMQQTLKESAAAEPSIAIDGGRITGATNIQRRAATAAGQDLEGPASKVAQDHLKRIQAFRNRAARVGTGGVKDPKTGRFTGRIKAQKWLDKAVKEEEKLKSLLINPKKGNTLVLETGHSAKFIRLGTKGTKNEGKFMVRLPGEIKPTVISPLRVRGAGVKDLGPDAPSYIKDLQRAAEILPQKVRAKVGHALAPVGKLNSKGELVVKDSLTRRAITDKEGFLDSEKLSELTNLASRYVLAATHVQPSTPIVRRFGRDLWAKIVRGSHVQEVELFRVGEHRIEATVEGLLDQTVNGLSTFLSRRLTKADMVDFIATLGKTKPNTPGAVFQAASLARFEGKFGKEFRQQLVQAQKEVSDLHRKLQEELHQIMGGERELAPYVQEYVAGQFKNKYYVENPKKPGEMIVKYLSKPAGGKTDVSQSSVKMWERRNIPRDMGIDGSLADPMAAGLQLIEVNPVENIRRVIGELGTLKGRLQLRRDLLQDPNAKKFVLKASSFNKLPASARVQGKEWREVKDDKIYAGLWFHPDLARGLDNMVKANLVSKNVALKTLRGVNHGIRVVQFAGSLFHQLSVTKAAFTDEVFLGWLRPKALIRSVKTIGQMGFRKNDSILKEPWLEEMIALGGGHRTAAEVQAHNAFSNVISKSKKFGPIWEAATTALTPITYLPNKYTTWLFNRYIPKLKALKYQQNVLRHEGRLNRQLTQAEKIDIIKEGQNFYGEMNERLFGRSGTATSVLRLIFTAPGFGEGNMRSIFTALGEGLKPNSEIVKMGWRSRMNIVNSLTLTAATGAVGTRIITGKWPGEPKDYAEFRDMFTIDTGREDENGIPIKIDLLYQDRDYIELLVGPAAKLAFGESLSKVSGELGTAWRKRFANMAARSVGMALDLTNIMLGKEILDWKGKAVLSVTDKGIQKWLKFGMYELAQMAPISGSVLMKALEKDQSYITAGITAVLGLRPKAGETKREEWLIRKLLWDTGKSKSSFFNDIGRLKAEDKIIDRIEKHNNHINNYIDTYEKHHGKALRDDYKADFKSFLIDIDRVYKGFAEDFGQVHGGDVQRLRRIYNVFHATKQTPEDIIKRLDYLTPKKKKIALGLYESKTYVTGAQRSKWSTSIRQALLTLARAKRFSLEKDGKVRILDNWQEKNFHVWRRENNITSSQSDYFSDSIDWRGVYKDVLTGKKINLNSVPNQYKIKD